MSVKQIASAAEAHPIVAWAVAILNWTMAGFTWLMDHADDAAKVFAAFGAIFGMVAAYYTMRIKHRQFKRSGTNQPFD